MERSRVYLDYNATAPVRPEAMAAFAEAAQAGGNPSSVHAEGRRARFVIEAARTRVAALLGTLRADGVVFVSGGTEAANMALAPLPGISRLLVGATEHAAVLRGNRFPPADVEVIPVAADGRLDLNALRTQVRAGPAPMLALQAANNETGVLQPVAEAAEVVRGAGGIVVCDAVQAAGRIDCAGLGADVMLLSAHKLGGLPGVGAAAVVNDALSLVPLVRGGGQELGLRGGTENAPAIAAFGTAAESSMVPGEAARLAALRDRFEAGLLTAAEDAMVFGASAPRLPNTCCFAVPGVAAERLMMAFDLDGIAVSSGSACSSGVVGRSHVLEAMGVGTDLRLGAIRVSFGWRSTSEDVERALTALNAALGRMRRPLRPAA